MALRDESDGLSPLLRGMFEAHHARKISEMDVRGVTGRTLDIYVCTADMRGIRRTLIPWIE